MIHKVANPNQFKLYLEIYIHLHTYIKYRFGDHCVSSATEFVEGERASEPGPVHTVSIQVCKQARG